MSLWSDIRAHGLKPGEGLLVILAVAAFLAGAASVAAYLLAWLAPAFRLPGRDGHAVADEAVILCYAAAVVLFVPLALWVCGCIPTSRGFFVTAGKAFLSSAPWLAAVWLAALWGGTSLLKSAPGETEWLGIAVVCAASGVTLLVWLLTWRCIAGSRRCSESHEPGEPASPAKPPHGEEQGDAQA